MGLVVLGFGLGRAYSEQSLVDQRLGEAFVAVLEASESHGDPGRLVDLLNQALAELETGADPETVLAHLDQVVSLAAEERARGADAQGYLYAETGAKVLLVGVLAYAAWRRLPGVFWAGWLRARGGWLVENADR